MHKGIVSNKRNKEYLKLKASSKTADVHLACILKLLRHCYLESYNFSNLTASVYLFNLLLRFLSY